MFCHTLRLRLSPFLTERQVSDALSFSSTLPLLINVHGGRDGWPREQQEHYFTQVLAIAAKLPVPVVHETHRGRSESSAQQLQKTGEMRLG